MSGRTLAVILLLAVVLVAVLYEPSPDTSAGARIRRDVRDAPQAEIVLQPSRPKPAPVTPEPAAKSAPGGLLVRVQDGSTLAQVQGALVGVARAADEDLGQQINVLASTDDTGSARLPVVLAPRDRVVVAAAGYRQVISEPVEGREEVVVSLEAGARIAGRVRRADGTPVAGSHVRAYRRTAGAVWPYSKDRLAAAAVGGGGLAVSSADGSFEVRGLTPGVEYEVHALAEGLSQGLEPVPVLAAPQEDVLLTLVPQASLSLRFVDEETGQPLDPVPDVFFLGSASVDLRRDGALPAGTLVLSLVPHAAAAGSPPKELGLVVRRLGYDRLVTRMPMAWGESATSEIRMKRSSAKFVGLRVTASLAGRRAFSGPLTVTFSGTREMMTTGMSFREGRAERLVEVPPGQITISTPGGVNTADCYWKPLKTPVTVVVRADDREQDVPLVLTGQLLRLQPLDRMGRSHAPHDIRVVVPAEMEVSSTWYRGWAQARRKEWGTTQATADAGGRADWLLWLPPGDCEVFVNVPEIGSGKIAVAVGEDGDEREVHVHLLEAPTDFRPFRPTVPR